MTKERDLNSRRTKKRLSRKFYEILHESRPNRRATRRMLSANASYEIAKKADLRFHDGRAFTQPGSMKRW